MNTVIGCHLLPPISSELQLLLCLPQLSSKMIIPLGPEAGQETLDLVEKDREGKVTKTKLMGVKYVPLC